MDPAPSAYDELSVYTMSRPGFILQHVVDAFGAQAATRDGRPIRLVFALVGLYLRVEKGLSGHAVQQVHRRLGSVKRAWPAIRLPATRGAITAADVMQAPEGEQRDVAIDAWCQSVWTAFSDSRAVIVGLLQEHGIE